MGLTRFPHGVSSFGLPVIGSGQIPVTSGDYFFVSSVKGSSGNTGADPDHPINTIANALLKCTANNGDVIVVMPGHTQTISTAGGLNVNVAGVYIIGLGTGTLIPTYTFSATAAQITVTAANVTFDNFKFTSSIDAVVAMFSVSAASASFKNCLFHLADATYQATSGILTTAAADGLLIEGCQFEGTTDAGTTVAVDLVGGSTQIIRNNNFYGAYSSGVGAIRSTSTASTNITIINNTIVNATASSTKAITLLTGSTGIISNNRIGIGSGAVPFTGDATWWSGNWSAAAVATNGTLV